VVSQHSRLELWRANRGREEFPLRPVQNTSQVSANAHGGFSKWQSQCAQDATIVRVFGNKTRGWFVDLAANHARKNSNTFVLERHFAWSGICIEPNHFYWKDLISLQTCQLVKSVVGKYDGEGVDFALLGQLSGIWRDGFDNNDSQQYTGDLKVEKHTTVSVKSVLVQAGAPSTVDYLSLDIEGEELYVMENFNFDKYTFWSITVERPRHLRLCSMLESKGYVYVMDHCDFGDELYIHKNLPIFDVIFHELSAPKPSQIPVLGWGALESRHVLHPLDPANDSAKILKFSICRHCI